MADLRVTVWNEFIHEREDERVRAIYPDGMHAVLADAIGQQLRDCARVRTATLDQPEHGLGAEVLADTDVLTWWGHRAHDRVDDAVVDRVQRRVLEGMGLVVLHSGHASKIFRRLMGTGCMLRYRDVGERERVWVIDPGHPIAAGIADESFELPHSEMYGEHFDIPAPDELVFVSWFQGGEVFRSGCAFRRGKGRIFYFSPGHESYPIFHDANVRRVIANAVAWAAPAGAEYRAEARRIDAPVEPIPPTRRDGAPW